MKKLLVAVLFLSVIGAFAQENIEPKVEKKGDLTEVTYFHNNGNVEQIGTFNAEGKLHGMWTSFCAKGKKVAVGNYAEGNKVGKWFFWNDDSLKEVDYVDGKIVSVNKWANSTKVAINN